MPNKMLIDASHPEETRVVVLRGNRIEEFDFESQDKKQLRGNIYLARVTRVEPSLQAAFVEYGGNRHGFLAFSEIHPDYYQIPVADRQALLEAEAAEAKADDDDEDSEPRQAQKGGRKRRRASTRKKTAQQDDASQDEAAQEEDGDSDAVAEAQPEAGADADAVSDDDADTAQDADGEDKPQAMAAEASADVVSEEPRSRRSRRSRSDDDNNGNDDEDDVDTVGADDAMEEAQPSRRAARKNYKIQEVIKRRQILLVQVVKEERGNKGAALTTYLSLAGRYSVLMPNTARGGGISRKITNVQDRKRLKDVVKHLEVPQGMGVILRTAGANRTKAEIKRDYDYLMRLWEKVRSLTLESTAPALVYEEGSLIKRSVRDLYNKDIGEILVAGEEGYREAKDFMRMLMPSHAKVVQPYRDVTPIFAGNGIEAQLDRMLQPQVTLKSGGYIIINQTEALVAIDVNSGRSTKEHSIEDTALQTNLEAAEEVARQLRLRDMAGLIVIDFIDMEENRNNRAVEKRLKECLKNDRARIQVGRISHFGLLEMSRQRIRASVLESTMQPCPHCGGTGHIRSDSSVALYVVRSIEEYLLKDARNDIAVRTPAQTALYLLNHKRSNLVEMENRFGVTITVEADDSVGSQHFAITKQQPADKSGMEQPAAPQAAPAQVVETPAPAQEAEAGEDGEPRKRRRKRKRRGGRNRNNGGAEGAEQNQDQNADQMPGDDDAVAAAAEDDAAVSEDAAETKPAEAGEGERKKRHRGKRGGRRNRRDSDTQEAQAEGDASVEADVSEDAPTAEGAEAPQAAAAADTPVVADEAPAAVPEAQAAAPEAGTEAEASAEATDAPAEEKPARKPRRRTRKAAAPAETAPAETADEAAPAVTEEAAAEEKPAEEAAAEEKPAPKRRRTTTRRSTAKAKPAEDKPAEDKPAAEETVAPEAAEEAPSEAAPAQKAVDETVEEPAKEEVAVSSEPVVSSSEPAESDRPRKTGWWQRKSFF
ncbi:ribonuclease E/G [Nitratireductor aquimarinus]|uniref:Rne/Rng family ribonuclease n=1 Tax=Alphaproteobacteria TaxID=28211 RepID=UPI0019D3C373|nr:MULTISPECIES: ribonuclease E/G [Alphaproteobacteria]MBN7756219.1 ribonuclease E/G [Nitratireductor aquimarinus]MBY5998978.1 ribonuclease E/G [Tritonibacter mobilis]MBY6021005.1 ribonuclease E/G [Nitratireductor sp. DP7N14-4]